MYGWVSVPLGFIVVSTILIYIANYRYAMSKIVNRFESHGIGYYMVESFKDPTHQYTVTKDAESMRCTCPDFLYRHNANCKHVQLVKAELNPQSN
jgi:hypothetical protein